MKTLLFEASDTTPKILFDPQKLYFEISGHSRPEDVRAFYKPVITWIKEFAQSIQDGEIKPENTLEYNFKMIYFNSSSAKFLLDVLVEINRIHNSGATTQINWYYDDGDDDMKEVGEDLSDMVDFDFTYIAK
jgi:SiaC family regulatory phosphoprotein